jgi:hypothetical protein
MLRLTLKWSFSADRVHLKEIQFMPISITPQLHIADAFIYVPTNPPFFVSSYHPRLDQPNEKEILADINDIPPSQQHQTALIYWRARG